MSKCAWRDANVCSILLAHGGMVPKNETVLEAVLKRARATKHPWLIACDADMSPEDFETSLCFRKGEMHVTAPEGVSTCRSKKGAKGAWVDKVYEYAIACNSSQEQRMPKVLLDTVEEGFQEEARKRKAGKKERKTREAEKEVAGTKELKKWLKACRRRLSMKVLKMKERKQKGQTSCEAGIAHRLETKKRSNAGKQKAKLQSNAKEVLTSEQCENFTLLFVDGTAKLCGRDHEIREATLRQFHVDLHQGDS